MSDKPLVKDLDEFISGWDNWSDSFFRAIYEEMGRDLIDEWISQYGDNEEMVVARFADILGRAYNVDASDLYRVYFEGNE